MPDGPRAETRQANSDDWKDSWRAIGRTDTRIPSRAASRIPHWIYGYCSMTCSSRCSPPPRGCQCIVRNAWIKRHIKGLAPRWQACEPQPKPPHPPSHQRSPKAPSRNSASKCRPAQGVCLKRQSPLGRVEASAGASARDWGCRASSRAGVWQTASVSESGFPGHAGVIAAKPFATARRWRRSIAGLALSGTRSSASGWR
jgi:hypothetical protein